MRVVPGLTIMRCVRSKPQGEAGAGEFSGSKIIPFGTIPSRFIPSREQRHYPSPAFRRLESFGALLESHFNMCGVRAWNAVHEATASANSLTLKDSAP